METVTTTLTEFLEAHENQRENDDPYVWIVESNVLLRALALPYADHPTFQEEWRP